MSKKVSNRRLATEPNQHSIVATSFFKAPRELVFKVLTDPETIPQWWGPSVLTTIVDKMEPHSGGSWRYIVQSSGGKSWNFHGVYHDIEAPERMVYTYEDEDLPNHVSMETTVLEDYEGGTRLTTTSVFQSVEDRDAMMASDMQDGGDETMDRLEELLAKLQAAGRD